MFTKVLRQLMPTSKDSTQVFPALHQELAEILNKIKLLSVKQDHDLPFLKRQMRELRDALQRVVRGIYVAVVAWSECHQVANKYSQLADELVDNINRINGNPNISVEQFNDQLKIMFGLCDNVLNEIDKDLEQLRQTFIFFPNAMQKRDLATLVDNFNKLKLQPEEILLILIKKYMQTASYKMKHEDDLISADSIELIKENADDAVALCKYVDRNKSLSEENQAFGYWLLFSNTRNTKSKKEIDERMSQALTEYNYNSLNERHLSSELFAEIFSNADSRTVNNAASACRLFRGIVSGDKSLARHLCVPKLRDYSQRTFKTAVLSNLKNGHAQRMIFLSVDRLAIPTLDGVAIYRVIPKKNSYELKLEKMLTQRNSSIPLLTRLSLDGVAIFSASPSSSKNSLEVKLKKIVMEKNPSMLARLSSTQFVLAFDKTVQIWDWKAGVCTAERTEEYCVKQITVAEEKIIINTSESISVHNHDLSECVHRYAIERATVVTTASEDFMRQTSALMYYAKATVFVKNENNEFTPILIADERKSVINGCWQIADNKLVIILTDSFETSKKLRNIRLVMLNLDDCQQVLLSSFSVDMMSVLQIYQLATGGIKLQVYQLGTGDILFLEQPSGQTEESQVCKFAVFDSQTHTLIHEGLTTIPPCNTRLHFFPKGDMLIASDKNIYLYTFPVLQKLLVENDKPVEKEEMGFRV